MENIQSIRSRINTVQNIQKAATAMKLISTIKLAKLNTVPVECIKDTINVLSNMMAIVAGEAIYNNEFYTNHWLLRKNGEILLIVLSTDQGFCGSFKQSILNTAEKFVSDHSDIYLELFGKKMGSLGQNVAEIKAERNIVSRDDVGGYARTLQQIIFEYIKAWNVSDVYIISGEYVNAMTQLPRCLKLFPLKINDATTFNKTDFNISKIELFDWLFEKYLYSLCYNVVYEHLLAEMSVRVFSMDKTVRNADDMSRDLTLLYNRTRQAKITQELTEIVASVECIR